jgi:hypothetical protein
MADKTTTTVNAEKFLVRGLQSKPVGTACVPNCQARWWCERPWGKGSFEGPESVEGLNKFLGVAEDRDEVGLGTGAGIFAGFELAVEEDGGIGEFFSREVKGGAMRDGRSNGGLVGLGHQ